MRGAPGLAGPGVVVVVVEGGVPPGEVGWRGHWFCLLLLRAGRLELARGVP